VPLLVGGTGLWLKALIHGLFEAPKPDPKLRERLESELRSKGSAAMHARLMAVDPDTALGVDPADRQRIVRALEYYEQTGERISEARRRHGFAKARYRCMTLAVDRDRDELKRRLTVRLERMLEAGWIEEVRALLEAGVPRDARGFTAHGYRHVIAHVLGERSLDEIKEIMLREHVAYTKRSRTWYRKVPGMIWLEPPVDMGELGARVVSFLSEE